MQSYFFNWQLGFFQHVCSFNTYKSYWKHTKYFIKYIKENHPECSTLKSARKYVNEWLQSRVDQGLSAWTVQLEAKAMGKLYQIDPDDENYFKHMDIPPIIKFTRVTEHLKPFYGHWQTLFLWNSFHFRNFCLNLLF